MIVKYAGIIAMVVGILWAILAMNMDVSVGRGLDRVANFSLIAAKNNHLMIAGIMTVVGAILTAAGYLRRNEDVSSQSTASTRPCPHCAEEIKPAATVCRYCQREVEPLAKAPEEADEPHLQDRDNSKNHVMDNPIDTEKLLKYIAIVVPIYIVYFALVILWAT